MHVKTRKLATIIFAALLLQSCSTLLDYLSSYTGSLQSSTVGDMIYLESVGDSFMFGKLNEPLCIQESQSFSILVPRYEVTNEAYQAFIDNGGYSNQTYWNAEGWNNINQQGISEPAFWNDSAYSAPDQPAVGVSWFQAFALSQWLTFNEGFTPAYNWHCRQ